MKSKIRSDQPTGQPDPPYNGRLCCPRSLKACGHTIPNGSSSFLNLTPKNYRLSFTAPKRNPNSKETFLIDGIPSPESRAWSLLDVSTRGVPNSVDQDIRTTMPFISLESLFWNWNMCHLPVPRRDCLPHQRCVHTS